MAVISWLAGLFYLPRLFVYHADAAVGSQTSETFKIMQHRLIRIIMTPAMVVTWITGVLLAWGYSFYLETWFLIKFALVLMMSAFHSKCVAWHRAFQQDVNTHDSLFFRKVNELPTVLMMVIVILVVIKPF